MKSVYLSELIKTIIMKTKNDLKTGILIGIGIIVIPLILMSTTYTTEKQNKFEIHVRPNTGSSDMQGFLLNTETGETWFLSRHSKSKHK